MNTAAQHRVREAEAFVIGCTVEGGCRGSNAQRRKALQLKLHLVLVPLPVLVLVPGPKQRQARRAPPGRGGKSFSSSPSSSSSRTTTAPLHLHLLGSSLLLLHLTIWLKRKCSNSFFYCVPQHPQLPLS